MNRVLFLLVIIFVAFSSTQSRSVEVIETPTGSTWAFTWNSVGYDEAYKVMATDDGSVYLAGRCSGEVNLDPFGLSPDGVVKGDGVRAIAFVAKYDSDGRMDWVKSWSVNGYVYSWTFTVDVSGNVYIAARTDPMISRDPDFLVEGTDMTVLGACGPYVSEIGQNSSSFVLKLDTEGNYMWDKNMGNLEMSDIEVDSDGNLFVVGDFTDSARFDPDSSLTEIYGQGTDAYVSKFDTDGTHQWTTTISSDSTDRCQAISVHNDAIFVAGDFGSAQGSYFSNTPSEESEPKTVLMKIYTFTDFYADDKNLKDSRDEHVIELQHHANEDGYLARLDQSGVLYFIHESGGSGSDVVVDVKASDDGVYVVGNLSGSANYSGNTDGNYDAGNQTSGYLCRYDLDGELIWDRYWERSEQFFGDVPAGIDLDVDGNVYVLSSSSTEPDSCSVDGGCGQGSLISVIEKFSMDGETLGLAFIDQVSTYSSVLGESVAVGGSGEIYAAGKFIGGINLSEGGEVVPLDTVGHSSRELDAFLMNLTIDSELDFDKIADGADYYEEVIEPGLPPYYVEPDYDPPEENALEWVVEGGGTGQDSASQLLLDSSGNLIVIGSYTDEMFLRMKGGDLPDLHLYTDESYPTFMAKYEPDGSFVWAQTLDLPVIGKVQNIQMDGNDILITSILYADTLNQPVFPLNENGPYNYLMVSRYNSSGEYAEMVFFEEIKTTGFRGLEVGDVYIDSSRNYNFYGSFKGETDFDPTGESTLLISHSDFGTAFLARFSENGDLDFVVDWGSTLSTSAYQILVDTNEDMYLTGTYTGAGNLVPGGEGDTIYSIGSDNFIMKFDHSGDFEWVKTWGGDMADGPDDAVLTDDGFIYITGMFWNNADFAPGDAIEIREGSADMYLSKLDLDGNLVWVQTWGSVEIDGGDALGVDADGNIYVCGDCNYNSVRYWDNHIPSMPDEFMILKYDSDGNLLWEYVLGHKTWEPSNWDRANDILVTDDGFVYVIGHVCGETDFEPGPVERIPEFYGVTDYYLLKLKQ